MALRAIRGWGRFPRLDFISVTSHSGHAGLTDSVFEMHASHARRERAGLLLACTTADGIHRRVSVFLT
jgi:hypothetical protein